MRMTDGERLHRLRLRYQVLHRAGRSTEAVHREAVKVMDRMLRKLVREEKKRRTMQ